MTAGWLKLAPWLAAAAAGAAVSAAVVWPLARAPLQISLADLRTEHAALRETNAESVRLATLAVAARLQAAQAAGEAASTKLALTLAHNDQLTQEKSDALKAATTGRACLSERAVRVLNRTTAGASGSASAGLPAPASESAAEGEAAATDTDVSGWIAAAQQQYDACRAQLDTLIDWFGPRAPREGGP